MRCAKITSFSLSKRAITLGDGGSDARARRRGGCGNINCEHTERALSNSTNECAGELCSQIWGR